MVEMQHGRLWAEGSKPMQFNKRDMIEQLKLEISIIRDGGYNPSVRRPRQQLRTFRDSITCLNVGLERKEFPCDQCFLIQFVPPEHRDKVEPCHLIPLNERGQTIASLQNQADRDKLEAALLTWLHATISSLEKEIAREQETVAQEASPATASACEPLPGKPSLSGRTGV